MHASLDAQDADWEAVLALDGADPALLPAPLAADPRVRVLALPRPVGAACARNLAVNLARGKALTWADDDDVLPRWSLSSRLHHLDNTGLGWVAGYSADLHSDGSLHLWRCPVPPGRHEPGAVWSYWPTPYHTIPIGPTTIMARTGLWSAIGGMGGLVQGEDYLALKVTFMAAGNCCRKSYTTTANTPTSSPSKRTTTNWKTPHGSSPGSPETTWPPSLAPGRASA